MPRIFMLTHRRYVPTPPVNNVLNHSPDDRATVADERMVENSSDVRREEQEEAVDLVVHKVTDDSTSFTGNRGSNDCYDSRCTAFDQFKYSNDPTVYHGAAAHSPLFTVKAGGHDGNSYIVEDGHDDSAVDDRRNSRNETSNTIPTSSSDNGMDLSMKDNQRYQQVPPPPLPPPSVHSAAELHDKAGLSDGDSDSGCSTQNETRCQLPPEVEYGWAECHAHFSLLYDLMTQGSRKLPAKDIVDHNHYTGMEIAEHAPYDYSKAAPRESQEPTVLCDLMTESPRRASCRDVPDHAVEVEVPMLPYQHHQQPLSQDVQCPTPVNQCATPVSLPSEPISIRYEARRSLNDLLFAAGLPPTSPPSPSSLSSTSSRSPVDAHACDDCGKRYSTSSNLARHRQTHRSHGDKKARKCPHCEKVYVSMPAFSMHVRTHNQGCACPHCGKRFSRPWLLQGHIRTHTGEKPFACPQCGKSFADKSNLRAHIQTHSTEKPYVCGRCGKAFALKSYLYKHEESSCMRGERFRPLKKGAVDY